ncbi:MAG TPA: class I SAM-dependent methyltransferase, partial [Aggregatilineaceae bacterium]|nr:class I SAM-dependent methyltransferase [Aggregatilineaceae bacterium]
MNLPFFTSTAGRALLHDLAAADLRASNTLTLLTTLRRTMSPEQAGEALTLARLRQRAADKFTRADTMFFTPDALEQSSGELISRWCAARFAGYDRIADLGCGVGGDSLALAAVAPLIGVDRDASRLQMARLNLAAYDLHAELLHADLFDPLPFRDVPAAFFDPARRVGERRVFSVRDYIPPLDIINRWRFDALAVKLSPGVDLAELQPYSGAGV